eukprot:830225_1
MKIAASSAIFGASITVGISVVPFLINKLNLYFQEEEEKMTNMVPAFFNEVHKRSQRIIQRQIAHHQPQQIKPSIRISDIETESLSSSLNHIPELDLQFIRHSVSILKDKVPIITAKKSIHDQRPASAPVGHSSSFQPLDREAMSLQETFTLTEENC